MTLTSKINFRDMKVPDEVIKIIGDSATKFLSFLTQSITNLLTGIVQNLTKIPVVGINIIITILATYFICTDKFYILDQIEHQVPKPWVKKIGKKVKKISSTLGGYLKAEITLIAITFMIVLIGLYIFKIIGFEIQYPLLVAFGIGFVDALPILGSGTILIPWAIISAINGNIKFGVALLLLYAITLLTKQLIEPKIVSEKIGIHPIFTLIAMYTGVRFMGLIGLLIGPIVLIILKNVYSNLIDDGILKSIFNK